ncbi:SCO-spondin isoform X2 [Mustela putorius furo]|uniref:SCO-spondin isoform X2 n=1 Tax=Mustela putorius furo TaxID=9669 RepID=A0A8U0UVE7_MUSPF|nr:SCO-spondin isoform X2 [Mustela putorius furo]
MVTSMDFPNRGLASFLQISYSSPPVFPQNCAPVYDEALSFQTSQMLPTTWRPPGQVLRYPAPSLHSSLSNFSCSEANSFLVLETPALPCCSVYQIFTGSFFELSPGTCPKMTLDPGIPLPLPLRSLSVPGPPALIMADTYAVVQKRGAPAGTVAGARGRGAEEGPLYSQVTPRARLLQAQAVNARGVLPSGVPADQSPAGPDAYEDVVDGAQSGGLGHICQDGTVAIPCPAGSFKRKKETSHSNTSFSSEVLSQCLQCPAGYFCPTGATHPIPCQPGTFSPNPGQDEATDCIPCPAGRACTQAGLTQPDATCTPGYVCPVGSLSPHAPTHACPPGTFSSRNNLSDLLQCEICPSGLACPRGTGSPYWPPIPCPVGHYCPLGTKEPTQFQCPPGTWSSQTGLTAVEECAPCPRGWFCSGGAQLPSGTCKAGHYCPQGTMWGTQFPCPAGTYSSQAGNGQVEDCLLCPPGAFCPSGAPKPMLCPRGTSRQSPGARLAVACVLCPIGHHCPEPGTATPLPCSAGSFSGPGHLWCQECPEGKLCNQTKLASPTACPPGHYCPAGGLLSIPCPMGTFREAPGAARVEDCQLCHPGTFCGRTGLAKPQGLCSPGHHCGPGSNTSSPEGLPFGDLCPAGHFCPPGTKDARQRPCPIGTWNVERGAQDLSWCLPCPPGLFCAAAGQAAPTGPCAPGYYCPGGAWMPRPISGPWGDLGPVGHICPEGSLEASRQPDGQHNNRSGDEVTHQERCIHAMAGGPCPPGHFCPLGTGVPLPCPVGTFSDRGAKGLTEQDSHLACDQQRKDREVAGQNEGRMLLSMASECLSCPPGHFCGASGLTAPSGPCSPGYFCLERASSPIPAGHSHQGGPCPRGHFCPSGTSHPQPCPPGSYSNLTGQASCFPCPAGYYCPENITTYSGHPCPAGFYCPRGTKYATQYPCPRGYYNPDPLTQSLDSCLPCPPGHYCGQENLTQASGPCDAGWFCVSAAWTSRPFDLDNYTSTNCLCPATATGGKCPSGSFCPEGTPEPIPCLPGSFCATSGLSTPSGPCQAGYFCAEGAVSPAPEDGLTGAPCPPGTFCPAASHRPTPCPVGTFSSLPEQTMPSACQVCPRSFYCKEAGLQAPSGQCPAGYYCDSSAGPIQDFHLYPCPQGYFCPLGTAVATLHRCPVGTYGSRRGLRSITECQLCPAGKFCALAGLMAPTGDCAAGHWCKGGATSKDPTDGTQGLLCPAGHYCLEGAPVPTQCPPGTWSEEGNRTPEGCQDCSGGRLCSGGHLPIWLAPCYPGMSCTSGTVTTTPVEGLSRRSCPSGHFCPLEMADPSLCPPGSYASGTHTAKCYICPSGHYCVPGLSPQLCPRGFYCPEGTGLNWQPCPPGTYGPVLGLSSLPGCQACDGGRFCPSANATEAGGQCWEGFFCSRGSTRPNPEAGTEEEAGPCPQGHYCPRGSAVPQPCPPGTFSIHTKLSSEAACSPCPPGHYCGSAGLTSPSGPCSTGFFCRHGALVPNGSLGEETSGPCPAGHFCPPGTVTPRPCPAGTYNRLAAQGHCESCPEGFFCPSNTSSVVGNECPAGHYCPASTSFASQFPCPRGTYRPQRGGVQQSDCTLCDPGSYCLLPGLVAISGPCRAGFHCIQAAAVPNPTDGITGDLCPPGHFCPKGSPRPTPCPPGSLLPIPGATSQEDCQPCPGGWFCSRAGLSFPEAPCEGGWFCPRASVSGHSPGTLCPVGHSCPPGSLEPQLCPPGQYQDEPGQSLCKICPAGKFCSFRIQRPGARPTWPVNCPPGYYCPLGTWSPTQHPCPRGTFREWPGARSAEDCRPCPAGQFCSDSGSGKPFPDGLCSPGYYCPPGQTSATPTSFRCPRGFYCPEGSPQPRACENGTFQPQEAKGSCEPCPAGFYCEASGTGPTAGGPNLCLQGYFCPPGSHSAMANPCPRGTFGPRQGASAELDCELCPAGMFCSSEGLSQPSGLCHAAYYCTGGAVSPTPLRHKVEAPGFSGNDICPPGFFCPRGTGFPVPCLPGFYSSAPGLASEDQCLPCPPGHYCSHPGLSHAMEAELCDAGYICLGGSAVPSPSDGTHGYRCPPGFHCPPGAHSEQPCEPGTFSPLPGADTCLPCPGGTYCQKAATVKPTTCPKGHYCPGGTSSALPCPEGTLNPREGSLSPRACHPCPAGRYCPGEGNGQTEGPCSAGYYCEGGAASPTPQRKSAFPLNGPCPQGHYCPQGTLYPVPCPMGTTRSSPGGTSEESCGPCPAGSFCPGLGLSSPISACVAGSKCSWDLRTSSPMAFLCPQGHFCQPGSAWPAPCHQGEYQPSLGSDTCLSCPPGFHCPHPGTKMPRLCPAHAYCPTGTWSPPPCPPGTFTSHDASGLREEGDCSICHPGSYCRGGRVWGKCPAGYFCPAGTSELTTQGPMESQPLCPQGQLCAKQCPPGFYCPEGSGEPTLCPPHTVAAAPGAKQQDDCGPCPAGRWCKAGDPTTHPCPAGHYCPGGNKTSPGTPQACPEHTYLAAEGGQSLAECLPCPPGYHCLSPGLSSFKSQPCPPGYWCPGDQGAFLCPPGTFRTKPGASSQEDCELCPPGHYCPQAELQDHANMFVIPCRAGAECPAGSVAEVTCRAGSYCGPQTGVPPLCPGGYACPAGSSTYTGPGQLCVFPFYCPVGSAHPRACPGGSEALNGTGLRVSKETCCRLCEAGTYRSQALDSQTCQPCPPGFTCHQGTESYHSHPCPVGHYCPAGTHSPRPCPLGTFRNSSQAGAAGECLPCPAGTFSAQPGQAGCLPCGSSAFSPPGASSCMCRGLNRVFQKSDGFCICQAGHESYSRRGLESEESNGDEDCQPQVAERCWAGEVRLAATRKCVTPQLHDCSSFCHPVGGELSAELGICQCQEYVSAEELCDAQCLARAPQLTLAWGSSRQLILSVKSETGDSDQSEIVSTLGPDQFFQGNARVHLIQCGPHGIFGFVISRVDMLGSFLLGPPVSQPWLQRHHRTTGPEHSVPHDPHIHPHIPNPVVCLAEGDVILFQLHILPHNRSASHYPVYQVISAKLSGNLEGPRFLMCKTELGRHYKDQRRMGSHQLCGRFAHQFLDPGTYVFRDNGLPESFMVVLVKKKGVACSPSLSPVQPSSPYQLTRHGVLRRRLPNLGPDWAVITGVLLAIGLATMLLTGLSLILRPPLAQACPMRTWRPQWRGLGGPHVPTEYVPLRDSFLSYEDLSPWDSEEEADSKKTAITWGTGEPLPVKTLEDFSIRTLYDKLEDQSLHVAAQLNKHRSDALAFYRGASQQLQGLKDILQHFSATEQHVLGRGGNLEMEVTAATRTATGLSKESWGRHTAASLREPWQHPLGCTTSVSPLGLQPELDRVIVALASALSHACGQPTGASRKASRQVGEQTLPTYQQDSHLASNMTLKPQPLPLDEEHQSTRFQQDLGPGQLPQSATEGGDKMSPSSMLWILTAGHRHRAFPELQRKIWQVEDTLDEMNKEFFWLTAQALELQKEKDKPAQLLPSEGNTFVEVPSIFPCEWQEERPYPVEASGPEGDNLGTWALKSEQTLMLGVRRAHLAQRIEDLEWELSLLLQVTDGSVCVGGSWPSLGRH